MGLTWSDSAHAWSHTWRLIQWTWIHCQKTMTTLTGRRAYEAVEALIVGDSCTHAHEGSRLNARTWQARPAFGGRGVQQGWIWGAVVPISNG